MQSVHPGLVLNDKDRPGPGRTDQDGQSEAACGSGGLSGLGKDTAPWEETARQHPKTFLWGQGLLVGE